MFKDYDQKVSQNDLHALIREGEHGEQDFKYRISDARKIARTLSAFANTAGGRLLVGVRDNGSIAGVKDEDDIYMLESASEVFLKPALKLEVWAHEIDGKTVWEIEISEGTSYCSNTGIERNTNPSSSLLSLSACLPGVCCRSTKLT